jgi:hypothetical protein
MVATRDEQAAVVLSALFLRREHDALDQFRVGLPAALLVEMDDLHGAAEVDGPH